MPNGSVIQHGMVHHKISYAPSNIPQIPVLCNRRSKAHPLQLNRTPKFSSTELSTAMKVFISYANSDREVADSLADKLSQYGLDPWQAEKNIKPGDNWAEKYGQALEEADALVVILSKYSADDSSISKDLKYAISNRKFKDRLVTIYRDNPERINRTDLPWSIKKARHVEIDNYPNRDQAFDKVARWLRREERAA